MNLQQYDYLAKLIIIGDSNVGKTNILLRFCENTFSYQFITTLGVDFKSKVVDVGSQGIMLVYAINDQQSYKNIETWVETIQPYTNQSKKENKVVIALIANKCDLEKQRQVSTQQGEELAKKLGIKFFETSALSNINITEAFEDMAKDIKFQFFNQQQNNTQEQSNNLQLDNQLEKNKHKKFLCF